MADTVVFLKVGGATQFSPPAGVTSFRADFIGAGGQGSFGNNSGTRGGGGGAGAALGVRFDCTPGEIFTASVVAQNGQALTTLTSTSGVTRSAACDYGRPTSAKTGGRGGQAANNTFAGVTALYSYSGGDGGTVATGTGGGTGGGGGAAGPRGDGAKGGNAANASASHAGGGGAMGGTAGGNSTAANTRGDGGQGPDGTGGTTGAGAANTGAGGAGSTGSAGFGAAYPMWTQSSDGEVAGPGGGGGGKSNASNVTTAYGGGGGGNDANTSRTADDGIIVITYTTPAGSNLTLQVTPAAFAAQARSVNLLSGFTLPIVPASFVATPVATALRLSHRLAVQPAPVVVTARPVSFNRTGAYSLPVAAAAIVAVGRSITLAIGRRLSVTAAALALSMSAVALRRNRRVTVTPAAVLAEPGQITFKLVVSNAVAPASATNTVTATYRPRLVAAEPRQRIVKAGGKGMRRWPGKRINEVDRRGFDWAPLLQAGVTSGPGDIVAWDALPAGGLVVDAQQLVGTLHTVRLSGGTAGVTHVVMRITFANGDRLEEAVGITITA